MRYQKNIDPINFSEQIKLLESKIAIIGCGGLGGNVIELLIHIGIGELILVDGDKFIESNLNRQIFCIEGNIEKNKVDVAAERVKSINSGLKVKTYELFIDSENIIELTKGSDVVVDALDYIPSHFILENAYKTMKIPLVHGAVKGFNGQ